MSEGVNLSDRSSEIVGESLGSGSLQLGLQEKLNLRSYEIVF